MMLHHPEPGRRAGDRRDRGAVTRRVLRSLGADLAGPFGIELYWIVLALAIILLLAVGSDYNPLLISDSRRRSTPGSTPASSGRWPAPVRW